jgi:UDP-GlcNAc:undecaprenyl-phosphate GlcNAc-1-phosphate transferase
VSWELALVASTLLSMTLVPILIRAAPRMGLVDLPNHRKVHVGVIPRVGGIAMVIAAVVPIFTWVPQRPDLSALLAAVLVLIAFGIWDDRGDLDYRIKFLGQILAAFIVVFVGGVVFTRVPFFYDIRMPFWMGAPITVVALVAITNAINLSDGLDGLAGGTTLLTIGMIALVAITSGDEALATTAVAVFGGILGFLRYNSYPARVFMGDTGSQFLGFVSAYMAIVLVEQTNTALSCVLPLLLLGLPILDTLAVMTQRLQEGRSPFEADKNHMHHKLMAIGFTHYEAVVIIYVAQAVLVTFAFLLRYDSDTILFLAYATFALTVLVAFQVSTRRGLQVEVRSQVLQRMDSRFSLWRMQPWPNLITRAPRLFVTFSVPLILILGALATDGITRDMSILSFLMLVILIVAIRFEATAWAGLLERLSIYVGAAIVAYCLELHPGWLRSSFLPIDAVFVVIVVSVIGMIRFSGKSEFSVSPLDLLVVFMVLMIPNLPDIGLPAKEIGAIAFKLAVLCYAAEILLGRGVKTRVLLRSGALVSLAFVAVRGFV